MKASEWLLQHNSHGIYDAEEIAKDFKKETGLEPCWPVSSAKQIKQAIKRRGLGGTFHGNAPAVAGYEIAESLADKLAPEVQRPALYGRGSRFRAALEALQTAKQ